jgi:hypothetical protein
MNDRGGWIGRLGRGNEEAGEEDRMDDIVVSERGSKRKKMKKE